MGNCCGGESDEVAGNKNFQGEGHRLGTANETQSFVPGAAAEKIDRDKNKDEIPAPIVNPNLTDSDRQNQREARLAAAEARMKKQGGPPKKASTNKAPLTGPNSKPAMTWQVG